MAYEHDGCQGCKFVDRAETDEPCRWCGGTVLSNSEEYAKRKDYYYPRDIADAKEINHDLPNHDAVQHPSHYCKGGIECIDAIRASMSKKEFAGYCKGNCLKYIWRYKDKGGIEDLRKAAVYLNWLIEIL